MAFLAIHLNLSWRLRRVQPSMTAPASCCQQWTNMLAWWFLNPAASMTWDDPSCTTGSKQLHHMQLRPAPVCSTVTGWSPPGDHLLDTPPGQPFRLHLWHRLAVFLGDPDADFLLGLVKGVPLGVNTDLNPSPAWPSHKSVVADPTPLLDCTDSWKSAHPAIVAELIQEELDAGFIAHVPGGLSELKQQFERTAVGKLGVVTAEGRSPRLVVDSSISNVTSNTFIPSHMMLPRISDILFCTPAEMAQQQVIQLTLDVSKAHRCILIDPQDGGMLCVHANGQLYRCITLNVGARARGWYWGRVAGLMVRTNHSLLAYGHVLWQYVDDLLAWLDKVSCPLWASLLVVLFLILGVPMSWHKAALACEVDWIGWRISVSGWSISVQPEKFAKIIDQVDRVAKLAKVSIKDLQSMIGRLLWLTSAWHYLRPLVGPGSSSVRCRFASSFRSVFLSLHHPLSPPFCGDAGGEGCSV